MRRSSLSARAFARQGTYYFRYDFVTRFGLLIIRFPVLVGCLGEDDGQRAFRLEM